MRKEILLPASQISKKLAQLSGGQDAKNKLHFFLRGFMSFGCA